CEPEGTARCDLSRYASELLDSWVSDRGQRPGGDPGPGEGAQELQEAVAEDDRSPEGCERQLQIESRGRGCAGTTDAGPARHHLVVAQDGEAEPFGGRADVASGSDDAGSRTVGARVSQPHPGSLERLHAHERRQGRSGDNRQAPHLSWNPAWFGRSG